MTIDAHASEFGTAVVPVMRYRNPSAAIDWLCKAFGFEKHHVTVANDGAILFAQLTLGNAMIMVGPVRTSAFDKLLRQPDEVGGAETQVCYFFVADAHAHSARAKAAGAEIIFDIEGAANGGRSYSCRDPEGHLWNFGTYNPWQRQAVGSKRNRRILRIPVIHSCLVAVLLVGVGVMVAPVGRPSTPDQRVLGEFAAVGAAGASPDAGAQTTSERLVQEQSARAAAERVAEAAQRQLTELQLERDALQDAAADIRQHLTQALSEKDAAEQLAKDVQGRLARAWIGKSAAERAAREARRQLARERSAATTVGSAAWK